MKFTFLIFAALLALSVQSQAADQPDTRTPLERYHGDSQFYLLKCALTLKLAIAKSEVGQPQSEDTNYPVCIREGKAASKTNLDKALRTVKKVKAREALKNYHVAFVTALEAILPGSDETRMGYSQRQQGMNDKVNEAWTRFEIEE